MIVIITDMCFGCRPAWCPGSSARIWLELWSPRWWKSQTDCCVWPLMRWTGSCSGFNTVWTNSALSAPVIITATPLPSSTRDWGETQVLKLIIKSDQIFRLKYLSPITRTVYVVIQTKNIFFNYSVHNFS